MSHLHTGCKWTFVTRIRICLVRICLRFRQNKSTVDAIVHFTNSVVVCFERGEYAVAAFIDLSKAFDLVDHDILIEKL